MQEEHEGSVQQGRITKDFTFEVKAEGDAGVIEGYASVFGNTDRQNDIVTQGAFLRTIKAWESKGRKVPVLWAHDALQPIGVTDAMIEDAHGLQVKATLIMDVQRAREVHALIKGGAITGLSVGITLPQSASDGKPAAEFDREKNTRILREVRLWEWSPVTFPANEEANIVRVKTDPLWSELTEAVRELRDALDQREVMKQQQEVIDLLREVRGMMKHATATPVVADDVVDTALAGVLMEARQLLSGTMPDGRRA